MKIEFTGRQTEISTEVRKLAERKLDKIARSLPRMTRAHVILTADKHRQVAEVSVHSRNLDLSAVEVSTNPRLSVSIPPTVTLHLTSSLSFPSTLNCIAPSSNRTVSPVFTSLGRFGKFTGTSVAPGSIEYATPSTNSEMGSVLSGNVEKVKSVGSNVRPLPSIIAVLNRRPSSPMKMLSAVPPVT